MLIKITREEVQAFLDNSTFPLEASQKAVSFPIIERIHRRLQQGHRFSPIKVLNKVVIDGHHRYICLSILNLQIENVKAGKNEMDDVKTCHWSMINVDKDDYDTKAEIKAYEKKYD